LEVDGAGGYFFQALTHPFLESLKVVGSKAVFVTADLFEPLSNPRFQTSQVVCDHQVGWKVYGCGHACRRCTVAVLVLPELCQYRCFERLLLIIQGGLEPLVRMLEHSLGQQLLQELELLLG